MIKPIVISVIVALIFLVLYGFNVISAYWLGMLAVIFIVLGIILTFMLAGSGESNNIGLILLIVGIILVLIIYFVPK